MQFDGPLPQCQDVCSCKLCIQAELAECIGLQLSWELGVGSLELCLGVNCG